MADEQGMARPADGRAAPVHAFAARHHVVVERTAGSGRLPRGDPVDDLAMFARGYGQGAALRERRVPKKVQLVDEAPIGAEQLGIAGELDHPVVEIDVRGEVGFDIASRGGSLHPLDAGPQVAQRVRGGRLRETPADELVEHGAQLVDFVGFLDRDLAHEDAAVLFEADEAGLLERAEGFAYGPARDTEARGDRRFVELAAGRKLPGQDHPLELLLDQHRQRARLHERDGAARVASGAGRRHGDGSGQGRGTPAAPWRRFQHVAH